MGASQSTAVDEGITVVHHGTRASAAQQDDMALLAQLAALMHVRPLALLMPVAVLLPKN